MRFARKSSSRSLTRPGHRKGSRLNYGRCSFTSMSSDVSDRPTFDSSVSQYTSKSRIGWASPSANLRSAGPAFGLNFQISICNLRLIHKNVSDLFSLPVLIISGSFLPHSSANFTDYLNQPGHPEPWHLAGHDIPCSDLRSTKIFSRSLFSPISATLGLIPFPVIVHFCWANSGCSSEE